MIPKRLFFLWFGEKECPYEQVCIKSYKDLNPDFEIVHIHEKDFNKASNDDIKECLELINTEGNFFNRVANDDYRKNMITKYKCYNTNFSYIFRFYLWNKYGGMYVDMDTLCYRPIDENVLKQERFFSNNSTFFQGGVKGSININWKYEFYNHMRAKQPFFAKDSCYSYLFNKGDMKALEDDFYKNNQEDGKYLYHFRKHNWSKEAI